MRTVLITGFEPFGGDTRNPSGEIARLLDDRRILRRRIVGAELPCVFGQSLRELRSLMRTERPELVVCLGLASNRVEITPERVAINIDDARMADNAGRQPVDRPIVRGGPTAYWSTLPIKAIAAALRKRRIPAAVSQTAGTFVCNHVFYGLMEVLRSTPRIRGGFIHLPWPADWAGGARSTIPFQTMVSAIETAVTVSLQHRRDTRIAGGAIG